MWANLWSLLKSVLGMLMSKDYSSVELENLPPFSEVRVVLDSKKIYESGVSE